MTMENDVLEKQINERTAQLPTLPILDDNDSNACGRDRREKGKDSGTMAAVPSEWQTGNSLDQRLKAVKARELQPPCWDRDFAKRRKSHTILLVILPRWEDHEEDTGRGDGTDRMVELVRHERRIIPDRNEAWNCTLLQREENHQTPPIAEVYADLWTRTQCSLNQSKPRRKIPTKFR